MAKVRVIYNETRLKLQIKRFQTFMTLERGLSDKTRDLYTRIMSTTLRETESLRPSRQQIMDRLLELHEKKRSSSHIRNHQLAVENYMAFLGVQMEFTRPKKKPRMVSGTMSDAEVAVLVAASENIREKAIVGVLASSGIRNAELCNLRVRDIDIAHHLVHVHEGKGGRSTARDIGADAVAVVIKYLQVYPRGEGDYLFTTLRANARYTETALRRLIKKLAKKARLEKRVYPHLLRHSLATSLLRHDADIQSVQQQLGHAHLITTMIYIHSDPVAAQRVIARCRPSYF